MCLGCLTSVSGPVQEEIVDIVTILVQPLKKNFEKHESQTGVGLTISQKRNHVHCQDTTKHLSLVDAN